MSYGGLESLAPIENGWKTLCVNPPVVHPRIAPQDHLGFDALNAYQTIHEHTPGSISSKNPKLTPYHIGLILDAKTVEKLFKMPLYYRDFLEMFPEGVTRGNFRNPDAFDILAILVAAELKAKWQKQEKQQRLEREKQEEEAQRQQARLRYQERVKAQKQELDRLALLGCGPNCDGVCLNWDHIPPTQKELAKSQKSLARRVEKRLLKMTEKQVIGIGFLLFIVYSIWRFFS